MIFSQTKAENVELLEAYATGNEKYDFKHGTNRLINITSLLTTIYHVL